MLGLKVNHVSERGPWWKLIEPWQHSNCEYHKDIRYKQSQSLDYLIIIKQLDYLGNNVIAKKCVISIDVSTIYDCPHQIPTVVIHYSDGLSDHRQFGCLSNTLFGLTAKKSFKVRITGLCVGFPLVTSGFLSRWRVMWKGFPRHAAIMS